MENNIVKKEVNNLISDIKPLLNSVEVLQKAKTNFDKKDSNFGDLLVLIFAGINVGYHTLKTVDDFNKLVVTVKKPLPVATPIGVNFYYPMQKPTFMLLKNQRFNA